MNKLLAMLLLLTLIGCAPFLYLAHKNCKQEDPCKGPKVKVLEW